MRRRTRVALLIAGGVVTLAVLALVVVHLPAVQRRVWDRATATILASSGWEVSARTVRLRAWPARLELIGVGIAHGAGEVVSVSRATASWSWLRLLGSPPRIESVILDGVTVDLRSLPEIAADEAPATRVSPLEALEVERLRLRGGLVDAAFGAVELEARGVGVIAGLIGARARLEMQAGRLSVMREERTITVGPLAVAAEAGETDLRVERLTIDGEALAARLRGQASRGEGAVGGEAAVRLEGDLRRLAEWWDPALAARFDPRGRVILDGRVRATPGAAPSITLEHDGPPVSVAGTAIDTLRVETIGEDLHVVAAGASWGLISMLYEDGGSMGVEAEVRELAIADLLEIAGVELPVRPPGTALLSGSVTARVPVPVRPGEIAGEGSVALVWDGGSLRLRGRGGPSGLTADSVLLAVPGGRIEGRVSIDRSGALRGAAGVTVEDPRLSARHVRRWWPAIVVPEVDGGAIAASLEIAGTVDRPTIVADGHWQAPRVRGYRLDRLEARAVGNAERVRVDARLAVAPGVAVALDGILDPAAGGFDGAWSIDAVTLAALLAFAPSVPDVDGWLAASGDISVAGGGPVLDGHVELGSLVAGPWAIDHGELDLDFDGDCVQVKCLSLELGGGRVEGEMTASVKDLDAPVAGKLIATGIDLGELPLPAAVAGVASAELTVAGTLARPSAEAMLVWSARGEAPPVRKLVVVASLADGQVHLVSREVETVAGPLQVIASAALGDLARPAWLWPDAPADVARLEVRGYGLRLTPALVGVADAAGLELEVGADIVASARWRPGDAVASGADVTFSELRLSSAFEELRAAAPVRLVLADGVVRLEPIVLAGGLSRIEAWGSYDLESTETRIRADLVLHPEVSRLLPVAVQIRRPIAATIDASGPLSALDGALAVTHREGSIVLRDPPLEVRNLVLDASLVRGAAWLESGSAEVNRGQVMFGGGWDVVSGQGIVGELEGVSFLLPMGILSRWSGTVAIEPDREGLARVVGDLSLDGGLWDRPFDIAASLFGGEAPDILADDPMHRIALDLEVQGRGGIRVANNLGAFDVGWSTLHVGGSAAQPVLEGELRLASGGQIALTGRPVVIGRGTIDFSGEPGADPRIEIVPRGGTAASLGGGSDLAEVDTRLLATRGLARGIGSVLGLENETLSPAVIAAETETDTGTRFSVGQRLSRRLALFLSTNLTEVQDRVTLLQLWNVRRFPGLAVQAFNETREDVNGAAVIERVRWGGSRASEDRPVIHKVRLKGGWPAPKGRLRKAAGVVRGQPYDPFLLFAAAVRLERELAADGYHNARVDAEAEGEEHLPELVFTCDPGQRQEIVFAGDAPPRHIRRQVTSLYLAPPLEGSALAAMGNAVRRWMASRGYPDARVTAVRQGDVVTVHAERGLQRRLTGPVVLGVEDDVARRLHEVFSPPAELARLVDQPRRGGRIARRLLDSLGYREATMKGVWTEVGEGADRVHLEISPGTRARVTAVRLAGEDPLGTFSQEAIGLRVGMALDRTLIDRALFRIRRQYRAAGYAEAAVDIESEPAPDGGWVLEVVIDPGRQRRLSRTVVEGTRHLKDSVVRRAVTITEGELVDPAVVDATAARVTAFAPIERAEVAVRPEGSDQARLHVTVTEKPRWSVGAGFRWRSQQGAESLVDLRDDNLLGRGYSVNLRGRWETEALSGRLLVAMPVRPGGRLSASASLEYSEEDVATQGVLETAVREERTAAAVEASFRLGGWSTVRPYARFTSTHIFEEEPDPFDPIDEQIDIVTVGAQLVRDRLDDPFDPTRGSYLAGDLSWSREITAARREYARALFTGSLVSEPRRRWTWLQSLRVGWADPLGGALVREARFFAGGETSMRGFDRDSVGPTEELGFGVVVPAGGGALVILNEELRVPLWRDLRVAVFADAGQVWESWSDVDGKIAVGAGLGLRWASPIGPVWADVAWPVSGGRESSGAEIYFGIGRTF